MCKYSVWEEFRVLYVKTDCAHNKHWAFSNEIGMGGGGIQSGTRYNFRGVKCWCDVTPLTFFIFISAIQCNSYMTCNLLQFALNFGKYQFQTSRDKLKNYTLP